MTPMGKLPDVGTTVFAVYSRRAAETGAINLGQGFPDQDGPLSLREVAARQLLHRRQLLPPVGRELDSSDKRCAGV